MKTRRVGVCLVGAGALGALFAERWNTVPNARVVSVADANAERVAKLAATCQVENWFTDYRPAIDRSDVHIVSICAPTSLHPEVAFFAAAHHKHVLCEKPIALTLDEADAMLEAARRYRIRLGIGFCRRYSPVLQDLRDWLGAGRLGHPLLYHSFDAREIRPARSMHDARMFGGPVIDHGVQLFDTWAYAFNSSPVQVYAQALKLAAGRPELAQIRDAAYDTATVVVRYASGDAATLVISWGLAPRVNPEPTPDRLLGPGGLAEVQFENRRQQLRVLRESGTWQTVSVSDWDMYQLEIEAFARAVQGKDDLPRVVSGEEGVAALRVAFAALKSIETGQPVSV